MPYFDPTELSAGDYNNWSQNQANDWNSMAAAQWSAHQQALRNTPELPPEIYQAQQTASQFDPFRMPEMKGVPGYMRDYAAVRRGQDLMTGNDPVSLQNNPLFNDPGFQRLPRQLQAPILERYTGHPMEQALEANALAQGSPDLKWSDIAQTQRRAALQKSIAERHKLLEQTLGYNPGEAANYRDMQTGMFEIPGKMRPDPLTGQLIQEPPRKGYMPEAQYRSIMQDLGTLSGGEMQGLSEHQAALEREKQELEARKAEHLAKAEAAARFQNRHAAKRTLPGPPPTFGTQVGNFVRDVPNMPSNLFESGVRGSQGISDWADKYIGTPLYRFWTDATEQP